MENGANNGEPGKAVLGDESTDEEIVARRLDLLAMASDSSTTIRSRSLTNVADWHSSLGKQNFSIVLSNNEEQSVAQNVHCSNQNTPAVSPVTLEEQSEIPEKLDFLKAVKRPIVKAKLVKTINQYVHTEGFRSEGIYWDGRDDFGDQLAKGVYIYRLKVQGPDGGKDEKLEKLVILK